MLNRLFNRSTGVYCIPLISLVGNVVTSLIRRRLMDGFKILKIMLGFENAQYLNIEGVEMLPVTYFKLETFSYRSYITVDGELVDSEVKTVEAKVVPKSLSILTK